MTRELKPVQQTGAPPEVEAASHKTHSFRVRKCRWLLRIVQHIYKIGMVNPATSLDTPIIRGLPLSWSLPHPNLGEYGVCKLRR